MLLDSKSFRELDQDLVAPNVLGFPGYEEKLERQRDKTGLMEAVVTARGRVEGRSVAAARPGQPASLWAAWERPWGRR